MNNKIDNIIGKHGKRVQPKAEVFQQAQNNVRAHWLQATQKHKSNQRQFFMMKMAASVFLLVSLSIGMKMYLNPNSDIPIEPMAQVAFVQGTVQVSTDNHNWQTIQAGQNIALNSQIKSQENALLNLTLNDNSDLRMNANSLIAINKATEIELLKGEIYHDADFSDHSSPLHIKTKFANIQHIGTRYAVKLDKKLQVTVRNGQVQMDFNQQQQQLKDNQQLTLTATGAIEKTHISPYSNTWEWAENANKPFDLQNKSLYQFVQWYTHEKGYQVDWNTQKYNTQQVKLAGHSATLSNHDLLKTVFSSTKYNYKIDQGVFHIVPKSHM